MHVGQRFEDFNCQAFTCMSYAAKDLDAYMRRRTIEAVA
jgi:hypothetical protein